MRLFLIIKAVNKDLKYKDMKSKIKLDNQVHIVLRLFDGWANFFTSRNAELLKT